MSEPSSQIEAPRRRRRRPLRGLAHLTLWLVLLLLSLIFLLGVAALTLTDRRLSLPAALTARIEERVNADFPGGRLALGRIDIVIDRRGVPRISAHNVDLRDRGGIGIVQLGDVGASFDPVALLRGDVAIRRLNLTGAEITVRRKADGGFSLSFGQGAQTFPGLGGLLDAVDAAFRAPPFDTTRRIEAVGLTVLLEDARSARVWQITGGTLALERGEDGLNVTVRAEIFNGTDDLGTAEILLGTRFDDSSARLSAKIDGVAAADIALQSPALSFLGILDAPISGAIDTALGPKGEPATLKGSLDIGGGKIEPAAGVRALGFDGARAAFAYDAKAAKITFTELTAQTEALRFSAGGHAYLSEIGPDGWPAALVGQFRFDGLEFTAETLFEGPVKMESGAIDLRFRPDPFSIEIGQLVLMEKLDRPESHLRTRGVVSADAKGWRVAVDAEADRLPIAMVKALWPIPLAPKTRKWITERIHAGNATDVRASVRLAPGQPRNIAATLNFADGEVQFMRDMPRAAGVSGYLTIGGERMTLAVEQGHVTPDLGGQIDVAGTTLVIPDMRQKPARGQFSIATESSLTGLLSLLTNPPVRLFRDGGSPQIADARASVVTRMDLPMGRKLQRDEIDYAATGTLTGLVSETLIKGRRLTASSIAVEATPVAVIAEGRALLDGVPLSGRWRNGLSPEEKGKSSVRGTIELSNTAAETFGVALPPGSVAGAGSGDFSLALEKGKPPVFRLTSDLRGLRLRLDALGWTKSPSASGSLAVEGSLGSDPRVDKLELSGGGLTAAGALDLGPGGAFRAAQFSRVQLGGWLDAPVTLTSRGAGRPPAIALSGGTFDMRRSQLGGSAGGGGGHGPIDVRLSRLVVSEGITLTDVRGTLDAGRKLTGGISGKVNGRTPIKATLVDGNMRITSDDAGGALRDAGLLKNARGGAMDLVLNPTGDKGTYDGQLKISRTRVLDAPAMAELLNALSLVGILDQLAGGAGIGFDDVEARFRLTPRQVILFSSSAVGASMGISMDGTYDLGAKSMNMQGVISPFYIVNVIGSIFTRKGEGLIGIAFNLTGPAAQPKVAVNPLSILTPGMFREIFRRPPPEAN